LNAVSDLLAQLVSEGLFEHRVSKRGERWRLTRAGREKARTVITAAEKKALGQAIHDLREQQGISLREFAEQTGLSQQGIINIEKGRSKPRTRTLECMARVLNVTVDELAKAA
jgi:DNA-binding XRE family transcriptional regulator